MRRYLALAAAAMISCAGAAQAGENPFVGEIETFGFSFCPTGWLPTNGALLPINGYTPLFSLLGTTYGGDGTTNFGLPNTRPIHTKGRPLLTQCIAYLGVFPSQGASAH
jgi:microcystin-dependent protein